MSNDKLKMTNEGVATRHYNNVPKAHNHLTFDIGHLSLLAAFVIGLLFVFSVGGLGCAKTVTSIVTYGDQMVVLVTLRGTMEVDANRYFLVLSSDSSYAVPLPPPDLIEETPEFIEPGDTPLVGSSEAYYTNFYSTWAGYISLDPSGYSLVKGSFVSSREATREVLSALDDINARITFSFQLEQIFAVVPDTIYFDFIAVSWPDGIEKIPRDHLPTTDNYISRVSGSIKEIEDDVNSSLDASLDILDCRVEIQ